MRIVWSDSEPEEFSQVTTITNTISTLGEKDVIVEAKRVSVAWLCFDKEKAYQRQGIDYVNVCCSCSGPTFLLLESAEFRDLLLLMRPVTRIIKAVALKNRIMGNNDFFISALMEREPSFDKEHHIRCFGDIFNLCAKDALDLAKDELSGIRDYIKTIILAFKLSSSFIGEKASNTFIYPHSDFTSGKVANTAT